MGEGGGHSGYGGDTVGEGWPPNMGLRRSHTVGEGETQWGRGFDTVGMA